MRKRNDRSRKICSSGLLALAATVAFGTSSSALGGSSQIEVKEGLYEPFFREKGEQPQQIQKILIDKDPVSNSDFLNFVRNHPSWRRSKIPKVFGSESYLEHWKSDLVFGDSKAARKPVTNVSWFAARAYCASQGKRLLSIAEWEYASDAQNPKHLEEVLSWYSEPSRNLKTIDSASINKNGLRGMHGLIWEWVEDFSSVIIANDSRDSNDPKSGMFCGAGSLGSKDPSQYATFMRYAFRSSLSGHYTGSSLGFRCATTPK